MSYKKSSLFLFLMVFTFLCAVFYLNITYGQSNQVLLTATNPATHEISVLGVTNAPAGATTPAVSAQTPGVVLLITIIPLLVPALVAVVKIFLPKMPSWSLPI